MLDLLLDQQSLTEAAFHDFAAARTAAQALGPQHRMGELERMRAGIDIKGQPLPVRSVGVSAAEKAALFEAQCEADLDAMVATLAAQRNAPKFAAVNTTIRAIDDLSRTPLPPLMLWDGTVDHEAFADDGDAICERAAERQADALEARDEAADCNGNQREWF
jgi:hypothetical protein